MVQLYCSVVSMLIVCLYVNLQDTRLPEAMSDAQSFHWETVDTKYVVNK